jgi:hypothetical protein
MNTWVTRRLDERDCRTRHARNLLRNAKTDEMSQQ